MSLRYSIWISVDKTKGETRYLFKDNSIQPQGNKDGIQYGTPIVFFGDCFFSMKDPHDAIMFCNYLNEQEGASK